jgi:hypothetical protein
MAIALDTVSYGTGSSSPVSWNHTCSGSDRLLIVAVQSHWGGDDKSQRR